MQGAVEFILSNIIIVLVVVFYLLSRLMTVNKPQNEEGTPSSQSRMPREVDLEHTAQSVEKMKKEAERVLQEQLANVNKRDQVDRSKQSITQGDPIRTKSKPLEIDHRSSTRIRENSLNSKTSSNLREQARAGMMWSQIYGPPRAKSPFQPKRINR